MRVSELWLRTLVDPPLRTEQLVEKLTCAALEVDSIERDVSCKNGSNGPNGSVGQKDTILTLKTPANRGDCLCMEGVARELSALSQVAYKKIPNTVVLPKISDLFPIHIEAPKACPRYVGRIIQNISPNAKTPLWMQDRLEHAGIRLVSPVVDITNYVMLELGQPLHAFDLNKLQKEIMVRFANKNEKLTTLDGSVITLTEDSLVIADNQKALALAGIMGGLETSITENTSNIFLECAYFDPVLIRMSSKHFGIRTDSSMRYERGIDPYLQSRAIERVTQLITEIMGGNPGPVLEESSVTMLPKIHTIFLRIKKIRNLLGMLIDVDEIQAILKSLEMNVETVEEGFKVTIPTFRVDIVIEEDLIEEIARIYGYDRIPSSVPISPFEFTSVSDTKVSVTKIKRTLASRGYSEAITYSFVSPELLQLITGNETALQLSNPISVEMAAMRTSLWPGLIQAVLHNQRRQQTRVRLFELGACFLKTETLDSNIKTLHQFKDFDDSSALWQQREMLSGICSGSVFNEQWGIPSNLNVDYFDVKADIEALLTLSNVTINQIKNADVNADIKNHETDNVIHFRSSHHPALHPGQSAQIFRGEKWLGWIGLLHPRIIKALDLQGKPVVFELDFNVLCKREIPKFHELSKYPAIRRDIAIVVEKAVLAETLRSAIVKSAGPLLQEVYVFDVYQGKGIEPGSKSVALGLILQHPSRTLVEAEVNQVVSQVVETLGQLFGAILRE